MRPKSAIAVLVALVTSSDALAQLGARFCASTANSTGVAATLTAEGDRDVAQNDLVLHAAHLPPNSFGYLLVARTRGIPALLLGSAGPLCLGTDLGRYTSNVVTSSAAGAVDLPVDLTVLPGPMGNFAATVGTSLQFQFWFRDIGPPGVGSNLSDGLCVTFCPEHPFAGVAQPLGVGAWTGFQLLDVDSDGALDEVAVKDYPGALAVHLGRGDGTFAAPIPNAIPPYHQLHASADLDGDGDLDFVVGGVSVSAALFMLPHLSRGQLGAPSTLPVGLSTRGVSATDIDGDGDVDLLVAGDQPTSVAVLENDGSAQFTLAARVDIGALATSVAAGDLDGDGDEDLVIAATAPGSVHVALNLGASSFGPSSSTPAAPYPTHVTLADVDLDGDLDVVLQNPSYGTFSVHQNLGAGALGLATHFSLAFDARGFTALDFDLDGDIDFISAATASSAPTSTVVLYRNDGQAVFGYEVVTALPTKAAIAAFGDVDRDGALDLAYGFGSSAHIARGDGTFGFRATLEPIATSTIHDTSASSLEVVDFDGDAWPDILAVTRVISGIGGAYWHAVRSEGDWSAPRVTSIWLGSSIQVAKAGDFDGDGRVDVFVAGLVLPAVFGVFRNVGIGQFGAAVWSASPAAANTVLSADFDGDGDLDVVLLDSFMQHIALLRNRGDGVFPSSQFLPIGYQTETICHGDLDADSDEDIYAVYFPTGIRRLRNDGGGQFVLEAWHPGPFGRTLDAADIDGDGDLDLVGLMGYAGYVALHRNLGGGTLASAETVDLGGASTWGLMLVDIERDGDLDLLAPTYGGHAVLVTNRGDGTFDRPVSFTAGAWPNAAVGADFDADGDVDVIAGSHLGPVLTLARNRCR